LLMQTTFESLISQIDNSISLSQSYFQQYKNYYDQGKYTTPAASRRTKYHQRNQICP
jgi:hypothetical protein